MFIDTLTLILGKAVVVQELVEAAPEVAGFTSLAPAEPFSAAGRHPFDVGMVEPGQSAWLPGVVQKVVAPP